MKKYLFGMIVSLLGFGQLCAQESMTASVDRNPVAVNEQFQLVFKLSGQPQKFSPPDLSNFYINRGPSSSSSISIVNGVRSQEFNYSYVLTPKSEGIIKINPAEAIINGQRVQSSEIRLNVKGQIQRKANPNDPNALVKSKVFYRALLSKRKVFKGEYLVLTYKLYYGLDIVQLGFESLPSFNGFWNKEIQQPQNAQPKTELYNGERYNTAVLKQFVLIPQKSGELNIDPFSLETVVRVPTNQVDIFGRRRTTTVKHVMKSNTILIDVEPLPKPVPSDFTGGVGSFSLSAKLNPQELKLNESSTLVYTLSGKGNLNLFSLPEPKLPTDIETYEPKRTENVSVNASGIKGSKKTEYLLVPRYGGKYQVPGFSISYFDPNLKTYKKLVAKDFNLDVEGEAGTAGQAGNVSMGKAGGPGGEVAYLETDILYLNTSHADLIYAESSFLWSRGFYAATFLSLFSFLGILLFSRRKELGKRDEVAWKKRKASKNVTRALKNARKAYENGNQIDALTELESGIYDYFSEKYNIRKAEVDRNRLQLILAKRERGAELFQRLNDILDICSSARFAGQQVSVLESISQTEELLGEIDARS